MESTNKPKQLKDDYLDVTICVWGSEAIGKTCFVDRFIHKHWKPTCKQNTEIQSFYSRSHCFEITLDLNIHIIPTNIDKEDPELKQILEKTVANIFCYSYVTESSLDALSEKWIPIALSVKPRIPGSFVCLKYDLKLDSTGEDDPAIIKANQMAIENNCFWYSCSAQRNENVVDIMEAVVTAGMSRRVGEITRNKEFPEMPQEENLSSPRIQLEGLFAPIRCSECQNGIEYQQCYSQCFAGECKALKQTFCDKCAKIHPHRVYREKVERGIRLKGETVLKSLTNVFQRFKDRPVFGWSTRNLRNETNGERFVVTHDNQLQWIKFEEFHRRALCIGRGLMKHCNVDSGDFVGICGRNQVEWYLSNLSCVFHDIRGIAVHTTYRIDDLHHLVTNARLKGIFCSREQIPKLLELIKTFPGCLKFIISLDPMNLEDLQELRTSSTKFLDEKFILTTLEVIERIGKSEPPCDDSRLYGSNSKALFLLQYTSGSTGRPKGVVITNEAYNYDIIPRHSVTDRSITVSYEPLAHSSYDNDIQHLCGGGFIVLYEDSMGDQFFADLQICNPSQLAGVPRIFNSIYTQYKMLIEQRISKLESKTEEEIQKIHSEVRKQFSSLLGDRIVSITIGGAPSSMQVREFIKNTFNCLVFNSYGTTESGGISANGYKDSNVEMILVDVPELGYTTQDKPYPRGEIAVRTKVQGKGYYREPELTAKTWTEEGFVRTGDIAVLEADNQFRIITRRKNISKLAQGEFVDPDKIQNIFLNLPLIDQIYVDIDSIQEYIIAVIVPIFPNLIEKLNETETANFSFSDSPAVRHEICSLPAAKNLILSELHSHAAKNHLLSYEEIRGVVLSAEEFTVENGLQTASNKLCRHRIALQYKGELAQVYEKLSQAKYQDAASYIDGLMNNVTGNDAGSSVNFIERGGDSLSALNLIRLLQERFQVEVPIDFLYNSESNTPQKLASLIAQEKLNISPVSRKELQNRISSDSQLSPDFVPAEGIPVDVPTQILLTGANGFIGMYLLREILTAFPESKIICLCRKLTKNQLFEAMGNAGIVFEECEIARVTVVIGDLTKTNFGVSDEVYRDWEDNLDFIYHCGALVNHFLSYAHLYEANVAGTKRILALCCRGKAKRLHHISTVGVLLSQDDTEDSPLQHLPCPLGSGYGASKWVSEVCVIQAIEKGFHATIYRPSQIAGHSKTGHSIPEHYINRLLISFIYMKTIPRTSSRIEVTAVDFCAQSIVAISQCPESLGKTFNISDRKATISLMNLQRKLDALGFSYMSGTVVDWITSLFDLLTKSSNDNDNEHIYRLLKPLTSYFDSQMSNFPSAFTPYIRNTEKIMHENNCYPNSGGISDERLTALIRFLANVCLPKET